MAPTETVRRTTPADAIGLSQFRCSTGIWWEQEVEDLIRGPIARRVLGGFTAWIVESGGRLVAVAAHEGHTHPGDPAATITYLNVLAGRTGVDESWLIAAARLGRLLRALFADVLTHDRAPLCYTRVAKENLGMRQFCERTGFNSGPVPSDPRYLFYTVRLRPTLGPSSATNQGGP